MNQSIVIKPADMPEADRKIINGGFTTIKVVDATTDQLMVLVRYFASQPARTACLSHDMFAVERPVTDVAIVELADALGVVISDPVEEDNSLQEPKALLPMCLPADVYVQFRIKMGRELEESELFAINSAYAQLGCTSLSESVYATINTPLRSSEGELLQITIRAMATGNYCGAESPDLVATFDVDAIPSEKDIRVNHRHPAPLDEAGSML